MNIRGSSVLLGGWHHDVDENVRRTSIPRVVSKPSLATDTTAATPVSYDKGIRCSSAFSNDLGHAPGKFLVAMMNMRGSLVLSDDWHADESVRHTSILRVASKSSSASDTPAAAPVSYDDQETQHTNSNVLPSTNVIVFGESGVGKSSVINMLVGEPVATVSNQATGCTFASTKFRATINNQELMLYDTAGLDEADAGTVSPEQAIQNLRSLVTELTTVNLLVYVIRGTRFRKIVSDNYHMFRAMIHGGDRNVPVVLVITGLENEENMDDWWEDNKAYLAQYKLTFCGHACITATKGRAFRDGSGYIFEDLYDASRKKVVDLLAEHAFNTSVTIAPLPKDTIFRRWWNSLLSELYQVGSLF